MNVRLGEVLKKQHEQAVGEKFAAAYVVDFGEPLVFDCAGDAPDLMYRRADGSRVGIEIASAYYDEANAKHLWEDARTGWGRPGFAINADANLKQAVAAIVEKKHRKRYGQLCWLVIDASRPLTDEWNLKDLATVSVPRGGPFERVFVCVARNGDPRFAIAELEHAAGGEGMCPYDKRAMG